MAEWVTTVSAFIDGSLPDDETYRELEVAVKAAVVQVLQKDAMVMIVTEEVA